MKKKSKNLVGKELLDEVTNLSGIPSEVLENELQQILDRRNISMDALTLEELRSAAASYLREVMAQLLDKQAGNKNL